MNNNFKNTIPSIVNYRIKLISILFYFIFNSCSTNFAFYIKEIQIPNKLNSEKVYISLEDEDYKNINKNITNKLKKYPKIFEIDRRSNILIHSNKVDFREGITIEYENSFLHYLTLGIYPQVYKFIEPLNYTLRFQEPDLIEKEFTVPKARITIGLNSIFSFWKPSLFTSENLSNYILINEKIFEDEKLKKQIAILNLQMGHLFNELEYNKMLKKEVLSNSKFRETVNPIYIIDFDLMEYFPKELKGDNLNIQAQVLVEVTINEFDELENFSINKKSDYLEINSMVPKLLKRMKWESGWVKDKKEKMKITIPLNFSSRG